MNHPRRLLARSTFLAFVAALLVVGLVGAGLLITGFGSGGRRTAAQTSSAIDSALPTGSANPSMTPSLSPSVEPTASAWPSPTPSPSPPSTATPAPTLAGFVLRVPILTYHVIAPWSVASTYSEPGLDTDPALFDAQLALLKANGWHTITVDRLSRFLAAKRVPPHRTFVITIDDGHRDGYTYAFPILRRYGFVATYYVVAGRIGETDDLTWEQLAALKAGGMEIGNHTMQHLDLAALSPAEVRYEIDGAQAWLSSHLGSAPTTLAYPFGAYDATVMAVIQAAGLRMALTTRYAALEYWPFRFATPRLAVYAGLSPGALLARLGPYG